MNELRWIVILCLGWNVSVSSQTVILEIAYQPNATYQWEHSTIHERTAEYIGAEDMQSTLDQLGINSYNENTRTTTTKVSMQTGESTARGISYVSTIDSHKDEIFPEPSNPRLLGAPLETDDITLFGVINRYRKMEIDSINGVDSLMEKNRVFELIDNIHRSLKYPKDTFELGIPIQQTSAYDYRNASVPAIMETTYLLRNVENGQAYFDLSYKIQIADNKEVDELMSSAHIEGKGIGELVYDITDKMVSKYSYEISASTYEEMMGIGVESSSNTRHSWSMAKVDK